MLVKTLLFFLLPLLFFNSVAVAEGTKEFWPDVTQETRILIAKGNIGGQQRDPFAVYNGAANYRLYIHISDPSVEKIYFGVGVVNGSAIAANGWRIHQPDGTVIYQSSIPTTGQGFIDTYDKAIRGPDFLDPLGYNALVVNLGATFPVGDYYMTFDINNNSSRTFKYFDITVINTTTSAAMPGRVFSKNWQFSNPSSGGFSYYVFKGLMFIYSSDGIVTKLNPNGMEGRDFSFSCNESGCYAIDPLHNAQQARQSQPGPTPHNYPQFNIFLNNPDPAVYPDGVIGHLVDGSVTTETFCTTGTVNFTFQTLPVNAIGTIEITLDLSALAPPLVDRILIVNNIPGGFYTITWDGLDGVGTQVPSGSTFPFTLRYTNGLTNMPLWDVEKNANGFIVTLVRPVQVPPLADPAFYWDDILVSGGQMIASPGCTTPPSTSCHAWGVAPYTGDWGNEKTINTWWYLVSNSTANVNLTYKKGPATLNGVSPPTEICQGGTATFTVAADPNSSQYNWVWDGGTQITTLPTITITFATALPGPSTVTVNGVNTDCGAGPVTTFPITINPLPVVTIAGPNSACLNSTVQYTTESNKSNYNWNVTGGAIVMNSGNQISVLWTATGAQNVSVIYTNPTGCSPAVPANYPVVVHALPVPVITGPASVCQGATGQVYSTAAGNTNYEWVVSSGAITETGGTILDNSITLTWTTPGIHTVYVNYIDVNGCTAAAASSFPVTVNELPNVIFNYITPSSCSGASLNIQLSSNVTGATFIWSATGSSANVNPQTATGAGNITQSFTNTGTSIENVIFSVTPSATGCSPVAPVVSLPVPIYPVPDLIATPASLTVCSNSQANIALSSIVENTTYSWTATGSAGITPLVVNGTGNIAETFQNSGIAPATVSFAIIPSANGCGNPSLPPYLLTVNPKPGVVFSANPTNPQTICSGTSTAPVNLQSTVTLPGVTYAWTAAAYDPPNPTTSITGFTTPNNGSSIPGENIISTLLGPGLIKYEVTASYTNGGETCPGDPSEYQAVVNPSPTVALTPANPTGQTICSGTSSQVITFSPNVSPTTYVWEAVEVIGISSPLLNGTSDNIPSQVLTVTGSVQGHVKYKVTPTYQGGIGFTCPGGDSYSTIFVNPLPAPLISSTSPTTVCELQPNLLYTTTNVVGNSYSWSVTGASSVVNGNTHAATVTWGSYTASPGTLTVTETIDATGCQKTSPVYSVILQQRPIPTLTGQAEVCEGSAGNVYLTEPGMTNYEWTISGGSVTSGGTATSNSATVKWITPGLGWIQVNYVNGLGCPGFPAKNVSVTVNPLPVSTISEGPGPACQSQSHVYQTPVDPASTFTWSIIPPASGVITSGQGTSNITIEWASSGTFTIAVTATKNATGCFTSSTFPAIVNPTPVPSFSACFDVTTTSNAKKFILRGGTPYLAGQGVYSGNRVSYNAGSGYYEFDPYGAGTGTYPVNYSYTNTFGCSAAAQAVTITIVNTSFICNGDLTDVRDGKTYKTTLINGKCWMKENLAYGTILTPSSQPQTDNCVSEKYCLASDAACTNYGGLYQWDELMAYATTSANQGLCPPEWHIPSETEWQNMVNSISNGIAPPADGIAGSFIKDTFLNPGFLALTKGIFYLNNSWDFTNGTLTGTMYWTSTPTSPDRSMARGVNSINPSTSRYPGSRGNAFSVRCVKD